MTLTVCVAGATGWTGRPVAEAVVEADDLELRSAVSRSSAGQDLGTAWGGERNGIPVFARVDEAIDGVDGVQVLVDYTSPEAVRTTSWSLSIEESRSSSGPPGWPRTTSPRSTAPPARRGSA